jgi:RNA polymerase sigma-70 factor (ECF subfamily)
MYQSVDDSLLVSQYVAGNKKSLDQLLNKYSKQIYREIKFKVKLVELSEDIFQETCIKIIKSIQLGKYKEEGKFLPWALRIANNLIMDHFRKLKNIVMISDSSYKNEDFSIFTHLVNDEMNWVDARIQDEVYQQIIDLLPYLPEEQREVIHLRIFEDLSFKEIAEQKSININTALGRMRYALSNIRKMIYENKLQIA